MGTTKNTLYKVKASPVPTIVGLNLESGAIVFDKNDSKIKGCDGTTWADLGVSGGSYSFVNGLTEAAGVVSLGGALTGNTDIDGASTYDFTLSAMTEIHLATLNGINTSEILFEASDITIKTTQFGGVVQQIQMEHTLGILVTDQTGNGFKYDADYSGAWTDRSVVDKAYVDSAGGAWTSQTLTADVTIEGSDLYDIRFYGNPDFAVWTNGGQGTYPAANLAMGSGIPVASLTAFGASGGIYGKIDLRSTSATIMCRNSSNQITQIKVEDTEGIEVQDNGGLKGMYYEDDYSANFTARSLVDLAYIQANFVAI